MLNEAQTKLETDVIVKRKTRHTLGLRGNQLTGVQEAHLVCFLLNIDELTCV